MKNITKFLFFLLLVVVSCKKEEVNSDLKSRAVGSYLCSGIVGYSIKTPPYSSKKHDTTIEIYVSIYDDSTLQITPNLVNGSDTKAPIIGYDNDTLFFSYPSHSVSYKNFIYKNQISLSYAVEWTSIVNYYQLNGIKR
jgi:hypothetical protein